MTYATVASASVRVRQRVLSLSLALLGGRLPLAHP